MSNELDKHISERLHRYESAVDAEAIWEAVKPPRRRRPWFWLLLLFGVISLAGSTWWLLSGTQPDTMDFAKIHSPKSINSLQTETITNESTPSHQSTHEQLPFKESNTEKSSLSPQSSKLIHQSLPSNNNDNLSTSKAVTSSASKHISASIHTKEQKVFVEEQSEVDEPIFTEQIIALEKAEQATTDDVPYLVQKEEIKEGVEEAQHLDRNLLEPINDRLPTLAGILKGYTPTELNDTINFDKKAHQHLSKKSPWSIQTDVAYLLIDRELAIDSNQYWVEQRLASESVLEAWNIDLSANYAFHKNWQLRAGLGYTQINTAFTFANTTTRIDSVEGLQVIIFNIDNTVDSIYGPVAMYETIAHQLEVYNSFRQLELPLLINYEAQWGHLSFIAEAGARIRLSRNWEGQVLSQDGTTVSLKDQQWYRNGLGVSVQAGLQLGYALSKQLQVRLGGTLRYSPSSFSTEEANFDERYQLRGLQLGLRYNY